MSYWQDACWLRKNLSIFAIMSDVEILYEDNHLLIVNKPAGMLSQGDKTGNLTIIDWGKQYIKQKYNKPGEVYLSCVHRLDRPVSGVIIMAKTSKALSRLNQLFKYKQVDKTYYAMVTSSPAKTTGKLIHFLVKDSKKNITRAFSNKKPKSKEAVLNYVVKEKHENNYLLEVQPLTGRPHQIRVQLASMGCPIKGDLKYGDKAGNQDGNIMLHAYQVIFKHPVKKELMTVACQPPATWGIKINN